MSQRVATVSSVRQAFVLGRDRRDWTDISLRTKLVLLTALAVAGGTGIGLLEVGMGCAIWPMWFAMVVLAGGLWAIAKYWILSPLNHLLDQLECISGHDRPTGLAPRLERRSDEIGMLTRGINRCVTRGLRDHCQAKHLRRTLDRAVEQATRQATRRLHELAMRDPLTGLGNRRFLDQHLEGLIRSSGASNAPLVCVAIDMDRFKMVNDTLGHGVGDDLLRFLADLIHSHKRQEDHGVRLGGDEFVVLMPGCTMSRAKAFCQQLIWLFRHHAQTVCPQPLRPDLSVGIASSTDGVTTISHLMTVADRNLYAAKRAGRGCVVAA